MKKRKYQWMMLLLMTRSTTPLKISLNQLSFLNNKTIMMMMTMRAGKNKKTHLRIMLMNSNSSKNMGSRHFKT
jgi:hypothetical protein